MGGETGVARLFWGSLHPQRLRASPPAALVLVLVMVLALLVLLARVQPVLA